MDKLYNLSPEILFFAVQKPDNDELFLLNLVPYVEKIPTEHQLNFRIKLMLCISKWIGKNTWSHESLPYNITVIFLYFNKIWMLQHVLLLTWLVLELFNALLAKTRNLIFMK